MDLGGCALKQESGYDLTTQSSNFRLCSMYVGRSLKKGEKRSLWFCSVLRLQSGKLCEMLIDVENLEGLHDPIPVFFFYTQ